MIVMGDSMYMPLTSEDSFSYLLAVGDGLKPSPDRHNGGSNISFADGHAEYWKWKVPKVFNSWLQPVPPEERQDWLRLKHGTLETLNRSWGTHFWGHLYQRWDEIPLPENEGASNPSALLDFKRFTSYLDTRFQHEQVEVLRQRRTIESIELAPRHSEQP